MRTLLIAAVVALGLAPAALAQTSPPATTPPSATAPDAMADAKFKSADKNNNGSLDGVEMEPHKAMMTQVDTDKDGKISRVEFLAGMKAGHIK